MADTAPMPTEPVPHPLVMALYLVQVDESPYERRMGDPYAAPGEPGYDDEFEPRGEWAELPEPFASALAELVEKEPGTGRCWQCAAPIGYVDAYHEDTYGREIETIEWRFVGLLHAPAMSDPVNPLCEDCTPLVEDKPYSEEEVSDG
jgi:hypothetical protein